MACLNPAAPQGRPVVSAPPAAEPQGIAADTNQRAPEARTTVQLSPYNLLLPDAPEHTSDALRAFNLSAARAVQHVYREDGDDPSVLLALQDQLMSRRELAEARPTWQAPLVSTLARANTLQALGPTLRALRLAMANAYFDERLHSYQDVDGPACAAAFADGVPQNDPLMNFVVTVEPIGTFALGRFRSICHESQMVSLRDRQLPGKPAADNVARLVRKLYSRAHLGGQVRRVSVLGPWEQGPKQYTLHAVVGVARSEGDDGCTMAEVSIVRPVYVNEPPMISEVGQQQAILCTQLR